MTAIVNSVEPGSIASDLEIQPGDEVISIDGVKPLDLIDYKYFTASDNLSLHIKRSSGEEEIIDIEKDPGEDLGLIFESAVFDRVIPCNNKCVFCFVDQQPGGLRKSLYVKDDDYRLSYLQGTYITLTNLKSEHKKRIEKLRPGPLYVSVHTTNPELRCRMLQNPKAGNILEELKWLNELEVPVHTQIVLCPGLNDGNELEKTLNDLAELRSNIASIAIVPVGITRYRKNDILKPVTPQLAGEVIDQSDKFNEKIGYSLAIASDEFYIISGLDFPKDESYRGYGQLDDGVGAARILLENYEKHKDRLPEKLSEPYNLTIATGQLAYEVMQPVIENLNTIENLNIKIIPVKSGFWGEKVTVSGLITGKDLLSELMPVKNEISNLVIPSVMLRKYTDRFLDDVTLEDVEEKLGINVEVIENYYSCEELIDLIIQNSCNDLIH